ncbi:MAG: DUF4254 domain-containing protein [bacterium]
MDTPDVSAVDVPAIDLEAIDVPALVARQDELVARWHGEAVAHAESLPVLKAVLDNHARNFELWHEEDKARDPNAGDAVIARVKRAIDGLNQARNDAMERVDEAVLATLDGTHEDAILPHNSESVGSIVDRLSILSLKIFHMREETGREDADAAHRESCRAKLAILNEQRADLADALAALLKDLRAGRKRFKVYRQMKMYNDPSLNPVLYGKGE